MLSFAAPFLLALGAASSAAAADVPPMDKDFDEVVVVPCFTDEPTDADVLRALPKAARNDITIVKELQSSKEGPPRFFPLVGRARLAESHFKCTVYSDQKPEVVYIDVTRLRPAP
jgi:hypothetical protein